MNDKRDSAKSTAARSGEITDATLDDVGDCPQVDVPLETAQLILGWTAP